MQPNPFDLTGRVALVTGASGGLGRRFAITLARAGAKVALAARRADRLAEVAREIEAFDGRAFPIVMDVTNAASVAAGIAATETELGAIAILVNNAGTVVSKPVLDHTEDDWDKVIDANLKGVWLVAQETARHMVRLGHGGSIVNIASMLAYAVEPTVPSYCVSKAAVVQLTRTLAVALARHKIRVNALAPGYFMSEMTRGYLTGEQSAAEIQRIPQRRIGGEGDLDGPLLLLASDASAYMTGSVILVDGGHSLV